MDLCRQWHVGELCDDAALLVSELVSNGIRHAGTDLLVELRAVGSGIVVAVSDGSTRPVRARAAAPLDEGGHGLLLVDALSTHWGVTARPSGKRVWAELQANSSR